ncbi:MAG: IS110 family transposase [Geminicoccales bacterium]
METGSLSPWLARGLEAMGLPVVCLDARQAKAVLSLRINKSDPNDAHGLAEIVRSGWYRKVQVKSQSAYQLQGLVGARAQLVKTKVDLGNQIRGLLRTFGLLVGQAGGKKFDQRVQELHIIEVSLVT